MSGRASICGGLVRYRPNGSSQSWPNACTGQTGDIGLHHQRTTQRTMNTKHTPGPWRQSLVNPCAVNKDVEEVTRGIATTHGTDDQNYAEFFPSKAEAEANARLIAAAPELLDALELALADLEQAQAETHIDFRGSIDAVREAIAKATGETI